MCATMKGDIEGLRSNFEAAIKTSGCGLYPIENYAKSLVVLNYLDDASSVMRRYADKYEDNVGFLENFLKVLSGAGRFHESAVRYRKLGKLGEAARPLVEEYKHLPTYSDLVVDLDDNTIADAVSIFGQYLRKIDTAQLEVAFSPLDEKDTGADRTGIEFQYFIKEDLESAAQFDFDGALFLADAGIDLVLAGILQFTIISGAEEIDADKAA